MIRREVTHYKKQEWSSVEGDSLLEFGTRQDELTDRGFNTCYGKYGGQRWYWENLQ